MASRVDPRLHRFWEAVALGAGLFLIVHGILGAAHVGWGAGWRVLAAVEAVVGVVTCAVDGWFLRHV